jgi:hypothetical protein
MYKAYVYTSQHGIMNFTDYPYRMAANHSNCQYNRNKTVFKNIGMKQEKSMSNEALMKVLMRQPVGVGILTNANFQFYRSGVMTEDTLKCSSGDRKVNHGVTVVGYG